MSKRKVELSWLNVVFCLLVVLIHVESAAVMTANPATWQYALVAGTQKLSFLAVYGFFFLSGLKLFLGNPTGKKLRCGLFYLRRSKTILLPYLVSVTVFLLVEWNMGYLQLDRKTVAEGYLLGTASAHFYFVVALVQVIVLTPLIRWIVRRYSPVVVLPFAAILTWISAGLLPDIVGCFVPNYWFPYSDRVFTSYLVFYLAGCYAGEYYQDFCRLTRQHFALMGCMTVAFGGLDVAWSLAVANGRIDSSTLGSQLHTLYLMSGILFVFEIACQWTQRHQNLPLAVGKLDEVSYLIYLYHCLPIILFNDWMGRAGVTDIGRLLCERMIFVYGSTIAACLLWRAGINWLKKWRKIA